MSNSRSEKKSVPKTKFLGKNDDFDVFYLTQSLGSEYVGCYDFLPRPQHYSDAEWLQSTWFVSRRAGVRIYKINDLLESKAKLDSFLLSHQGVQAITVEPGSKRLITISSEIEEKADVILPPALETNNLFTRKTRIKVWDVGNLAINEECKPVEEYVCSNMSAPSCLMRKGSGDYGYKELDDPLECHAKVMFSQNNKYLILLTNYVYSGNWELSIFNREKKLSKSLSVKHLPKITCAEYVSQVGLVVATRDGGFLRLVFNDNVENDENFIKEIVHYKNSLGHVVGIWAWPNTQLMAVALGDKKNDRLMSIALYSVDEKSKNLLKFEKHIAKDSVQVYPPPRMFEESLTFLCAQGSWGVMTPKAYHPLIGEDVVYRPQVQGITCLFPTPKGICVGFSNGEVMLTSYLPVSGMFSRKEKIARAIAQKEIGSVISDTGVVRVISEYLGFFAAENTRNVMQVENKEAALLSILDRQMKKWLMTAGTRGDAKGFSSTAQSSFVLSSKEQLSVGQALCGLVADISNQKYTYSDCVADALKNCPTLATIDTSYMSNQKSQLTSDERELGQCFAELRQLDQVFLPMKVR